MSTNGHDVAALWKRLEVWSTKHAKKSLRLRKGATKAAVAAAEKTMRLAFPSDFRASLLAHDGEEPVDDPSELFEWMPGCSPLASLDAIVERWTEEKSLAKEYPDDGAESEDALLNTTLWHSKRIPIAGTPYWDGDNTYVDLHPGAKGTSGQLITFVTECDLEVIGASFADALARYVRALDSGDWIYSAAKSGAVPKAQADDDHPNQASEFARYARAR